MKFSRSAQPLHMSHFCPRASSNSSSSGNQSMQMQHIFLFPSADVVKSNQGLPMAADRRAGRPL